jgi:hypothetical protein
MLNVFSHGLGVNGNVKRRKIQTDLILPRELTVAPAEPSNEPPPETTETAPPFPTANGEEKAEQLSSSPVSQPTLEERVRRLEDALAQLQQERGIQMHIVADRSPTTSTATLLDVGKRLLRSSSDTAAATPAVPPTAPQPTPSRSPWLLWDTIAEARAIARMFVDPRYQLSWSARILPLVLLAAILTSSFWVPGTSIYVLGGLIDKIVDVLLAFVLFKWLGHEARRYRQTSPDLPPTLRL